MQSEPSILEKQMLERKKANKKIKRIDNDALPAGSPMYFYCEICSAEMIVPETYMYRDKNCALCQEYLQADNEAKLQAAIDNNGHIF